MAADLLAFFAAHPVFSRAELTAHLWTRRSRTPKAVDALLRYHVRAGHLLKLRRGLRTVVPAGADPGASPVDPCLLASRLAGDAVLGYHTALELHGKAHSVFQEFHFLTGTAPRPFRFRGQRFRASSCGRTRSGSASRRAIGPVSTSPSPGSNEGRLALKGCTALNLFVFDAPLWNPTHAVAKPVGTLPTPAFPTLDIHELAAGKLAVLVPVVPGIVCAQGLVDRTRLRPGVEIAGPAIVEQLDATTVVHPTSPGWTTTRTWTSPSAENGGHERNRNPDSLGRHSRRELRARRGRPRDPVERPSVAGGDYFFSTNVPST